MPLPPETLSVLTQHQTRYSNFPHRLQENPSAASDMTRKEIHWGIGPRFT